MTGLPEGFPHFKTEIVCACGCGKVGRPRAKAWTDGLHVRDCSCRRCVTGQRTKAENRRVGRFARGSGLRQASGSGRRLGYDLSGVVAIEETSARELVEKLRAWWALKATQAKLERVRAQSLLPWAFAASWDDRVQLIVTDAESFSALCIAAAGSDMELAAQLISNLAVTWEPAVSSRVSPLPGTDIDG